MIGGVMKIKCIGRQFYYEFITNGKIYTVKDQTDDAYKIETDCGRDRWYSKLLFEVIKNQDIGLYNNKDLTPDEFDTIAEEFEAYINQARGTPSRSSNFGKIVEENNAEHECICSIETLMILGCKCKGK